jgi:hypothetical protein
LRKLKAELDDRIVVLAQPAARQRDAAPVQGGGE